MKSSTKKPSSPSKRSEEPSKDLLQGISEKEVEIEHLKTVIVALDEKLKVIDAVRADLALSQQLVKESEQARVALQEHMKQTAQQIKEEATKNVKFQDTLIMENKHLLEELDTVKQQKVELEKDLGQKNITI